MKYYLITHNDFLLNIGDIAIDYASFKFLNDHNKEYIRIDENNYQDIKINTEDIILIRGGGYFNLYNDTAESFLLSFIKKYTSNKIIILPSSFYINKEVSNDLLEIINNHQNITIFARDNISYLNYKKYFNCNILESPDMVLYLKPIVLNKTKSEILIISRSDNEMLHNLSLCEIGTQFSNIIHENKPITFEEHKSTLNTYFEKLTKAKVIITDTLHLSIFSYLLNIPCYSFDNKYGKVKNTILQYFNNGNVIYIDNIEEIKNIKKNMKFNANKKDFNFSLLLKELEG